MKRKKNQTTQHIPSIVHRRNSKELDNNNKVALKRNQAAKLSEWRMKKERKKNTKNIAYGHRCDDRESCTQTRSQIEKIQQIT